MMMRLSEKLTERTSTTGGGRFFMVLIATLAVAMALSLVLAEDAQANERKVTLCHDAGQETQKTIKVSKKMAKKHLAHGDTRGKCTPLASPTPAPTPPNCNQSTMYYGETVARAWGSNDQGQLGNGTYTSSNTPVDVNNLSGVKDIADGDYHSLALKEDCTVWAWGYNGNGQLGDGTGTNRNTPVQVQNLSGVKDIAASGGNSLALKEDGTVFAWGANRYGQLGDGTNTYRNTPVQVSNLSDVKAIVAGEAHSLALKEDGTVWAWGANDQGQLGDGTTTDRNTPVQVKEFCTLTPASSSEWSINLCHLSGVKDIAAGLAHSLALKTDGTVFAWGSNGQGQLGNGTYTSSNTPVQVGNLSGANNIATGSFHSLAVKEDGTVFAWGDNYRGQLGDGTTTRRNTPVKVSNLSDVKAIAAGDLHSLAKVSKPLVAQQ